jgi:hypothetical protein
MGNLLVLWLTACSEYDVTPVPVETDDDVAYDTAGEPHGVLEVTPSPILFAAVPHDGRALVPVQLSNVGDAVLDVLDVSVEGAAGFTVTPLAVRLGAGSTVSTDLQFTPADGAGAAFLVVSLEDGDVRVPIVADVAWPGVVIEPDPIVFGTTWAGQGSTVDVSLVNRGSVPVVVSNPRTDRGEFVVAPGWRRMILPGGSASLPMHFSPTSQGPVVGELLVDHDGPDSPARATIEGVGVVPPTVACGVTPDRIELGQSATYHANGTVDPVGRALDYDWTMVWSPIGSTATWTGVGPERALVPDHEGTWLAELVVTADDGTVSPPCRARLVVGSPSMLLDLWVELEWETSGDDLDLHVVAPGGGRSSGRDCHFANCQGGGLDWGVPGADDDDPWLDDDDISGNGPENVRIEVPEAGNFEVWVHDYPSYSGSGENRAHIRVWTGPTLVFEDVRLVTGEGSWSHFLDIDARNGVVTPR